MKKILVTPRSLTRNGHPRLRALEQAGYEIVFSTPGCFPSETELLERVPGCVGYLAGVEEISELVLDAATDLKVISRNGTGVDSIDLAAAARNGIQICRAEGANAQGVAELTLAHMLAVARSVPFCDHKMKRQEWQRRKGFELEGRTLGIVGCGKIGRRVSRFALSFGMRVVAFDPYPHRAFAPGGAFAYATFDEVVARADILSLHCPANADGTPLIGPDVLERMKSGAFIVNTARGSLLDADAVLDALDSGKLAGVTLDAFEPEPPCDWRLVVHERVVATPHIGGYTAESVDRAVGTAVDNLLAALCASDGGKK
jgi:D-3-phosphoglycerate dehydrogenase / 2-oxoglutarate reductase